MPHAIRHGRTEMAVYRIPIKELSNKALEGVIEEFVSREATDYGEKEISWDVKLNQVRQKLEDGSAVLVFDDETETTTILFADNPILKKLDI